MFQYKILFIIFLFILSSLALATGKVERTEDSDGVVNFSNILSNKSSKKTVIYKYPQEGRNIVFTDQKPTHITEYEVLKLDCFACNLNSTIDWNKVKLNVTSYTDSINLAANQHSIDPALIRAVIHAESAFNAKAVSSKGAIGLMQLMPATAKELGVKNTLNAHDNINGGTKYLAQLLKKFNGNYKLATAAYNAGPNAVKKYNGIPPYKETKVYVERVGILHQRYKSAH